MISWAAPAMAMYSASAEAVALVGWSLDFQETGPPLRMRTNPVRERIVAMSDPNDASEYAVIGDESDDAE